MTDDEDTKKFAEGSLIVATLVAIGGCQISGWAFTPFYWLGTLFAIAIVDRLTSDQ